MTSSADARSRERRTTTERTPCSGRLRLRRQRCAKRPVSRLVRGNACSRTGGDSAEIVPAGQILRPVRRGRPVGRGSQTQATRTREHRPPIRGPTALTCALSFRPCARRRGRADRGVSTRKPGRSRSQTVLGPAATAGPTSGHRPFRQNQTSPRQPPPAKSPSALKASDDGRESNPLNCVRAAESWTVQTEVIAERPTAARVRPSGANARSVAWSVVGNRPPDCAPPDPKARSAQRRRSPAASLAG